MDGTLLALILVIATAIDQLTRYTNYKTRQVQDWLALCDVSIEHMLRTNKKCLFYRLEIKAFSLLLRLFIAMRIVPTTPLEHHAQEEMMRIMKQVSIKKTFFSQNGTVSGENPYQF